MTEPVLDRGWRGYADLRRVLRRSGSARPALVAIGDPGRRPLDAWIDVTHAEHEAYRDRVDPATGRVAIVCVSNRPHRLAALIEAVRRQRHDDLEFVLVANDPGIDTESARASVASMTHLAGGVVLGRPEVISLGSCLNAALDATDARFVAKFDDDDLYGPQYLTDALRAHRYAGAGVVGKHSYYAHLPESGETILRFPGHEFRYSSTLAGGTLVIDRDRVGDLRFPDRSVGEDRAFVAGCHRRGVSTFSADRFNFSQRRGTDNTWTIDRGEFLKKSRVVDPTLDEHVVER